MNATEVLDPPMPESRRVEQNTYMVTKHSRVIALLSGVCLQNVAAFLIVAIAFFKRIQ